LWPGCGKNPDFVAKTDITDNTFCLAELVAQIVAQFRTDPARIMPNCPNQYLPKRLKTFNPISSGTFSRPPHSATLPLLRCIDINRLGVYEDFLSAHLLPKILRGRFPEEQWIPPNELSRGNDSEAIESLRAASPYELGRHYMRTALYPVFARGGTYLAARQGVGAVAEFQKILDHRGIVLNDPIGALAHLQMGRAYALQGETASQGSLSGFPHPLERRRPRHSHPHLCETEYAKLK
jgi:hypothetical protein